MIFSFIKVKILIHSSYNKILIFQLYKFIFMNLILFKNLTLFLILLSDEALSTIIHFRQVFFLLHLD